MKLFLNFLILFSVNFALAVANPLDTFVGNYKVTGNPIVTIQDMSFCGHYGLPALNSLNIKLDESGRFFKAELNSTLNNSQLISTASFVEYKYTSVENSLINMARLSGNSNLAVYAITNSNSYALENLIWNLKKTTNGIDLDVLYRYKKSDEANSSLCQYQVKLIKL